MNKRFTIYLVLCMLASMIYSKTIAQPIGKLEKNALKLVKKNTILLGETSQLLVVFNDLPINHSANLVAMEKKRNRWTPAFPAVPAAIGRNGFANQNEKREGDLKSPTGLFRLGQLFCYDATVETQMPYMQTTVDDKWIDDPESDEYNLHVRGETKAKSYEKLLLNGDDYRYCMVIEYNTNPIVKGLGSAIFFHLNGAPITPSAGCVTVSQDVMEKLLKWMKPQMNPSILMGTQELLLQGI